MSSDLAPHHLVERLELGLSFDSPDLALAEQGRLSSSLAPRLLSVIERVFDEMSEPGEIVRIAALEIDLGVVDHDGYEQQLEARLERALRDQLAERLGSLPGLQVGRQAFGSVDGIDRPTIERADLDLLDHVVRHGILPWHATAAGRDDLDRRLAHTLEDHGRGLLLAYRHHPALRTMIDRIVAQFPPAAVRALLTSINPAGTRTVDRALDDNTRRVAPDASPPDKIFERRLLSAALEISLRRVPAPAEDELDEQLMAVLQRNPERGGSSPTPDPQDEAMPRATAAPGADQPIGTPPDAASPATSRAADRTEPDHPEPSADRTETTGPTEHLTLTSAHAQPVDETEHRDAAVTRPRDRDPSSTGSGASPPSPTAVEVAAQLRQLLSGRLPSGTIDGGEPPGRAGAASDDGGLAEMVHDLLDRSPVDAAVLIRRLVTEHGAAPALAAALPSSRLARLLQLLAPTDHRRLVATADALLRAFLDAEGHLRSAILTDRLREVRWSVLLAYAAEGTPEFETSEAPTTTSQAPAATDHPTTAQVPSTARGPELSVEVVRRLIAELRTSVDGPDAALLAELVDAIAADHRSLTAAWPRPNRDTPLRRETPLTERSDPIDPADRTELDEPSDPSHQAGRTEPDDPAGRDRNANRDHDADRADLAALDGPAGRAELDDRTRQMLAAVVDRLAGSIQETAVPISPSWSDTATLETEGIFVTNAGMVLASPYLPTLFGRLDLLDGREFLDTAAAERGVHLLQFMADGTTGAPEYHLTLNKVLCGIPLHHPIDRYVDLSDEETGLVEDLLEGMIANWGTIGNTSVQGLRQSFLQREGRLQRSEQGWSLLVEQRSFDLLLDTVPWSFRSIRHPWMPGLLEVTWR